MTVVKQAAAIACSALLAVMVAPALAQPFGDVPAPHWAYDAIATLAAKGLVEGYADGTFKGNRAMTRYEMAMIVARLLARIEQLQIPSAPGAPAQPEVTKDDLDLILQLVNELRAELADKNVRLAPVEDELNAIKARLDNVVITGGVRFREDLTQANPNLAIGFGTAPSLNGNPRTSSVSAYGQGRANLPHLAWKVGFNGSVAPEIHFIAAIDSGNTYQFFNSSNIGFGTGQNGQPAQGAFGMIDSAFIQWLPGGWAKGLDLRLGRFGTSDPCGPCYPIQFGPFGLLMDDANATWKDTSFDNGADVADGLWGLYSNPNWLDLHVQAVWLRIVGNIGAFSYASGEDAYGIDANVRIVEGLRAGGYYVGNTISDLGATPFLQPIGEASPIAGVPPQLFHLYGPGGGALNPATARCPAAAGPQVNGGDATTPIGIACPAAGTGAGGYVQWDPTAGVHIDGEIAWWTDTTAGGGTDYGYQVNATADLQKLFGLATPLTFTAAWLYYGPNFYPPYGSAEADVWGFDVLYPGNAQGLTLTAAWTPIDKCTLYLNWIGGNSVSNAQGFSEVEGGVIFNFATQATITFLYRDLQMNGVDQENLYRAEINYSF